MSISARRVGISPVLIKACSWSSSENICKTPAPFCQRRTAGPSAKHCSNQAYSRKTPTQRLGIARCWPTDELRVEKCLMMRCGLTPWDRRTNGRKTESLYPA